MLKFRWVWGAAWCVFPWVWACGDSNAGKLFGPPGEGEDRVDAGARVDAGGACLVRFDSPSGGQVLTLQDDEDADCSNGVQTTVEASVTVPNGTEIEVTLGAERRTLTVSDGTVRIPRLDLPASGESVIRISVPGDASCQAELTVTSRCDAAPSCAITSPTKSVLNGESAPLGDRVGTPEAPFRTRVVVTTSAPDGAQVTLDTGNDLLLGIADGGLAEFPAVLLAPDGEHVLTAQCSAGEATQTSAPLALVVDSEAPVIELEKLVPVDGQRFTQDALPQTPDLDFDVCVPVQSGDALGLAGAAASNVCVAIGNQAPTCGAAEAGALPEGGDGVCVRLECPGSAPFALDLGVLDAAGNRASHSIAGVSCTSTAPSVEIVNLRDATLAPDDAALRMLAAGMPDGQLKDADAAVFGAQHDVVACTNAMSGEARLLAGPAGDDLTEVAIQATFGSAQVGECPADLPFVIRFAGASLPESVEGPDGELIAATELRVEVQDAQNERNQSGPVRLWVDSIAPSVTLIAPTSAELCDAPQAENTEVVLAVRLSSSAYPAPVTAAVHTAGIPGAEVVLNSPTQSADLSFPLGMHSLVATTTERSGNVGRLDTCDVAVGDPAVVTFVRPAPDAISLNAATTAPAPRTYQDVDGAAAGWQGTLQVEVSNLDVTALGGVGLQFELDGVAFGAPVALDLGVIDADSVTVSLNTSAVSGGIPESAQLSLGARLIGMATPAEASVDLVVDTVPPTAVSALVPQASSGPGDHRVSRFRLDWVAAGDGLMGADRVAGYRVAYSPGSLVTQGLFDIALNDTDPLTYQARAEWQGVPVAPGEAESMVVSDLMAGRLYNFAVQAVDAGLNLGPLVQGVSGQPLVSPGAVARHKTLVLTPPDDLNTEFGFSADGSTDLTGDGLAELVVGSNHGNKVYIYKGDVNGYSATPLVTISGPPGVRFGNSVAVVGDLNNDQPSSATATQVAQSSDLVIAAIGDKSGPTGARGRAYIFYGRDWNLATNQSLSTGANDHGATIDLAMPGGTLAGLTSATRLGDFNGDGADDFALTAPLFDEINFVGAVFVVFGGTQAQPFASLTLPDTTGSRAIAIYGATAGQAFGNTNLGVRPLVGIPDLFGPGSAALVVARPFADSVGAFRFAAGPSLTSADAQATHTAPENTFVGNFGFATTAGRILAVSNPNHVTVTGVGADREGSVDVFLSSAGDPLPSPFVRLYDTRSTDNFGQVLVGSAYSGRPSSYGLPLMGDPSVNDADLVVAASTNAAGFPLVYFIKGQQLTRLSGEVNLATTLTPTSLLDLAKMPSPPVGWKGSIGYGIRDMNGDGFADVAIAEFQPDGNPNTPPPAIDGRIIIIY
ncbi:MAG: hypothetical protein RJA70_279 [Pseudomonadota bacterium]|jgi:hypothetical protein